MAIRSFLAFELPFDIRKKVIQISGELKKTGLDAAWVRPENIHLTLIFMGDTDEKHLREIISGIGSIAGRYKPFEISLGGAGLFPDIRRPRVLWLGLNGERGRLSSLRDDLQKPLQEFGVKQERRPFKPHLTLARFRRGINDRPLLKKSIDKYKDYSGPDGKLDEITLFKSELKPGGSIYTKLHSWPL